MAKHSDYLKIYITHMDKFRTLEKRRDVLSSEMRRVHQMAKAAFAMMPEAERSAMAETFRKWELPTEGLTEAIRNVLFNTGFRESLEQGKRGKEWMTPVQIREGLEQGGYDFNAYQSNPLISVHGILKRLEKTREVNSRGMPDGSKMYRLSMKAAGKKLGMPQEKR